jgi:hypothetical protein
MKLQRCAITLISSLLLVAVVQAQDLGKLMDAADKQKAADSVDVEKMKGAVSTDGVDINKAAEAVDKAKLLIPFTGPVKFNDQGKMKEVMSTPK